VRGYTRAKVYNPLEKWYSRHEAVTDTFTLNLASKSYLQTYNLHTGHEKEATEKNEEMEGQQTYRIMQIIFWHPKIWLPPSKYVFNLRCMNISFAVEIIQK